MTSKQEVKTLEEKAQNHTDSFFLFLAWILGEFVCLKFPSSAGSPIPWHEPPNVEVRYGTDF